MMWRRSRRRRTRAFGTSPAPCRATFTSWTVSAFLRGLVVLAWPMLQDCHFCCWQSYESLIELQARVPLRLLAAGARLLFAPGDLGNILFFFHISSAKRCALASATLLCLPLCEASRARVLNSISRALPPDLSNCVVCVPARRA